jgi:alcohol dehydrogenase (cytochrome c)
MKHSARMPRLTSTAIAVALLSMGAVAQAQTVTDAALAAEAGDNWIHTNGNYAAHRYSTLDKINTGNAKNLKVAWIATVGGKTDAQATPSIVNGIIYFPQDNKVFAIDGKTGAIVWKYEHKLPEDWGGYNVPFFTGKHRGLTVYGDNVYFLSNDVKLHAIDMKTGKAKFVKDYAAEGFPYPKDFAKSKEANGYCLTVGPMAIPGTIIVPLNATDTGGLPGYVAGVDPANGNLKWKAPMIPGPGEPGADSWPGDSAKFGGAGPWITGSWDPELKMYFTGTANAYEWNPKNRGGGKLDNMGAASIVAVNTDNGKVPWRWVGVPGDPWDFDIPQTPMIITMDGKKTIVQPNKTGYVHQLDAKTGQFLKADLFIDKINWIKGYDKNGRPVGQIDLPKEGGDPVEIWPALLGGVNMYPNAYNPKTGLLYLAATESGMKYGFEEIKVISNVRHFGAYQEFIWQDEVSKGFDPKTGKEVWRDQKKGKPGYAGGMLTTAGGVTAYTTQGGTFQVVDAKTGQILFSQTLGVAAKAGPASYTADGKQYIVQALGGTPGFGRDEAHKAEFGHMIVGFTLQ